VNLLLLDPAEVDATGRVRVTEERARHLREVLAVRPGQLLRAGLTGGPQGRARVLEVSDAHVLLEFEVQAAPELERPRPELHLVLALPRPKILPRAVEAAVTLGVTSLSLVNAWRVERAYFASPKLAEAELQGVVRRACEQARDTYLPPVEVFPLLMPFVEARLRPWLGQPHTVGLVAHPGGELLERATSQDEEPERWVLAIGPEGGWVERELQTFEALGMRRISLGERILRTEHAVVSLLSQLTLLQRCRRG